MRRFRKATIKEVAQQAGVSTTTVSLFVSGREDVCSMATGDRIRAAVADLNYTPSSLVSGMQKRLTATIGVCMLSPLDRRVSYGSFFFERLWRGILRQAHELLEGVVVALQRPGAAALVQEPEPGDVPEQTERAGHAALIRQVGGKRAVVDRRPVDLEAHKRPRSGAHVGRAGTPERDRGDGNTQSLFPADLRRSRVRGLESSRVQIGVSLSGSCRKGLLPKGMKITLRFQRMFSHRIRNTSSGRMWPMLLCLYI